ncbi:unnamed protein product [Phytophthora lilii]|uniref:Unnamed protein product n=1 Tax=Phytophthora lilii TaxID=2077276 RepID=A0A9W7DDA1_9STRA|nr:unnamed protein product [Phytophthora lilii]
MSFLLGEGDQFASLGEVIEFIDAWEFGEAQGEDLQLNSSVQTGADSPNDVGVRRHSTSKSKKRKRRNLSSSSRLQQCKRAEILFLRKRVLELEEQMTELTNQRKCPRALLPRSEPVEVKSRWEELAEKHYRARLHAEEQNRSLKLFMASQVQATKALNAILQNQTKVQVRLAVRLGKASG